MSLDMQNGKDLYKMSLEELRVLERELPKAKARVEEQQRQKAMEALQQTAGEYGFSLTDLFSTRKIDPVTKTGKSPAKFRHPENAELTWSGRGRRPAWIKEILEREGHLESCRV